MAEKKPKVKPKPKKVDPELERLDVDIALAERQKARLEYRAKRTAESIATLEERLASLGRIRKRLEGK